MYHCYCFKALVRSGRYGSCVLDPYTLLLSRPGYRLWYTHVQVSVFLLYIVHSFVCTLYSVHSFVYTLYIIHCTLLRVYIVHSLMYTLYTPSCIQYTLYNTDIIIIYYVIHHSLNHHCNLKLSMIHCTPYGDIPYIVYNIYILGCQ